jgi:NitT/TauT family transport system permease protein
MKRIHRILLPLVATFILLALWELAVRATGATIFPSPGEVVRGIGELAERRILWS